jgi:hypothetical protein
MPTNFLGGDNEMSKGIEQKKALQPINCLEADTREQVIEPALLAAEFRKVSSQLGELRRRETHLLRRIAFLEAETTHLKAERKRADDLAMQFQASTSWRVTQPLRWLAKKLRIRRPMT